MWPLERLILFMKYEITYSYVRLICIRLEAFATTENNETFSSKMPRHSGTESDKQMVMTIK
jgi:hypothetical protein